MNIQLPSLLLSFDCWAWVILVSIQKHSSSLFTVLTTQICTLLGSTGNCTVFHFKRIAICQCWLLTVQAVQSVLTHETFVPAAGANLGTLGPQFLNQIILLEFQWALSSCGHLEMSPLAPPANCNVLENRSDASTVWLVGNVLLYLPHSRGSLIELCSWVIIHRVDTMQKHLCSITQHQLSIN